MDIWLHRISHCSEVSYKLLEKGYILPKGLIPMELLKEYLGINIAYLKKVSGR